MEEEEEVEAEVEEESKEEGLEEAEGREVSTARPFFALRFFVDLVDDIVLLFVWVSRGFIFIFWGWVRDLRQGRKICL